MKDPESKTAFYNEIAKKLLGFSEELERNNYIEAVAGKYNIRLYFLKNKREKIKAKMQKFRQVPEDKGGLLRAFIQKEYARKRYEE